VSGKGGGGGEGCRVVLVCGVGGGGGGGVGGGGGGGKGGFYLSDGGYDKTFRGRGLFLRGQNLENSHTSRGETCKPEMFYTL